MAVRGGVIQKSPRMRAHLSRGGASRTRAPFTGRPSPSETLTVSPSSETSAASGSSTGSTSGSSPHSTGTKPGACTRTRQEPGPGAARRNAPAASVTARAAAFGSAPVSVSRARASGSGEAYRTTSAPSSGAPPERTTRPATDRSAAHASTGAKVRRRLGRTRTSSLRRRMHSLDSNGSAAAFSILDARGAISVVLHLSGPTPKTEVRVPALGAHGPGSSLVVGSCDSPPP